MRAAPRPGGGALLLAALLGACAPPASSGPAPLAVTPRQGPSSAATAVEIAGVGFDAAVKTDYGDASGTTVQATFAAALVPWDGSAPIALGSPVFTQRRTLAAIVPAGLPPGRYDVAVTDPSGRTGTLPDGFEITSDAASAVAFQIAPVASQRAGVPFAIAVAAVDAAGRVVSGFTGSAALSDEGGTLTPTATVPFVLGRATIEVAVAAPRLADRISATDGAGRAGASNAFDVGPGIPARIAFVAAPAVSASSCSAALELELRDAAGAPAPAVSAVAVLLQSGPPGALSFFSDAACSAPIASIALAPGATRAALHLRGSAAGTASVRAVPDLLPSTELPVAIGP
jgi:hypothetical protein